MSAARRALLSAVAVLLVSGCAHDPGAMSQAERSALDEQELYAAIVRGTITKVGGENGNETLHCVRVCVRDECGAPSDEFLRNFVNDRFAVSGPDACKWRGDEVVPARDSLLTISSGRFETRVVPPRALFLEVEKVRFVSKDRVSADTSVTHGNVGANGLTLTLERIDGHWRVVKTEDTWKS